MGAYFKFFVLAMATMVAAYGGSGPGGGNEGAVLQVSVTRSTMVPVGGSGPGDHAHKGVVLDGATVDSQVSAVHSTMVPDGGSGPGDHAGATGDSKVSPARSTMVPDGWTMIHAEDDYGDDEDQNEPKSSTWTCKKYPILCQASCRCIPGDSCFPGDLAWSTLNQRLGGRLLRVHPPAYSCYELGISSVQCSEAIQNWQKSSWRSDQVGACQHTNWESYENAGCILPQASGVDSDCDQGSVPIFAVNVTSVADVQEAFNFAKAFNLRLTIKSSGNDYIGRSTGRGSLNLWMHHMTDITFTNDFHEHDRKLQRKPSSRGAVTIGAGVQNLQLLEAADNEGVVLVTPFSTSVSPGGGYFQGAGYGVLSPSYGLAADNVVEVGLVTPNGVFKTLNRRRHPKLFWAVRGGGGGTFGVVINVTFLTFPAPKNFLGASYVFSAEDSSSFSDLLTKFAELSPVLETRGWGGSFSTMHGEDDLRFLNLRYVVPGQNSDFADRTFGSLLEFVEASPSLGFISQNVTSFSSYLNFFTDSVCPNDGCVDQAGMNFALTSRLVPMSTLVNNASQLASAMIELMDSNFTSGSVFGVQVGGGAVAATKSQNSVNVAWRKMVWQLTAQATWNDTTTKSNVEAILAGLSTASNGIRDLMPDSGVYLNEVDYNEPMWKTALFGGYYDKLLAIKEEVDPFYILTCRFCVGSDNAPTGSCGNFTYV